MVVVAAAQHAPNPVERVAGAAAVPEGVLLDPAADLVHGVEAELHHVEGVQDADRAREVGAQCGGVTAERVQRRHPHSGAPALVTTMQPRGEHCTAATWHDVE